MNCEQVREELDLFLGQSELPEEMKAHLATCDECRAYAEGLTSLASTLGDDSAFAPDIFESNKLAWAVEDAIKKPAAPKRSWFANARYVAEAAVVLLAVAVGVDQYRRTTTVELPSSVDSVKIVQLDTNPLLTDNLQVSDAELEQMLLDYSTQDESAASELLQNLTDEEMQYLEKNFDVGELL
jgi:predicted anti-sigma-YlaC factor YlaD